MEIFDIGTGMERANSHKILYVPESQITENKVKKKKKKKKANDVGI